MKKQSQQAFTLIELLTIVAIIGILVSILVPVLELLRGSAIKTVDSNNLRQIGQASLIYARENDGRLPPYENPGLDSQGNIENPGSSTTLHRIATALARYASLNDATVWVSGGDNHPSVKRNLGLIWDEQQEQIDPDFDDSGLSFVYVAGLHTEMPATTPIAFTRGLNTIGSWLNTSLSVYGNEGGHVVFRGGTVQFYRTTGTNADDGVFVISEGLNRGERTQNILNTISNQRAFFATPNSPTGAPGGRPGSAN